MANDGRLSYSSDGTTWAEYGQPWILTQPSLMLTGTFANTGYKMIAQPDIRISQKHRCTHDCTRTLLLRQVIHPPRPLAEY